MGINVYGAVSGVVILVVGGFILGKMIGRKGSLIPLNIRIPVAGYNLEARDVGLGGSRNTDLIFTQVHGDNEAGMGAVNILLDKMAG
jgi:hypothetical protein